MFVSSSTTIRVKISLKQNLNWTKGNDQSGSTVEHQPVGKLVQQSFGEAQFFFCSNVRVASFANLSISRHISSLRPKSIMFLRNLSSRMNRS